MNRRDVSEGLYRLEAAEEAVLTALERELLDREILEEAAARAAARVASSTEDPHARRHALEAALAQAETALARLTEAVTAGGAVAMLVQAITEQERREQTLRAELADLDRPRIVPLSVGHMKAKLQRRPTWRALLRTHAPIARQMVRKLVEGRIVFTPDPEARRYTFLATGTLANFFSGPRAVASLIFASWNQLCGWLKAVDGLRHAA